MISLLTNIFVNKCYFSFLNSTLRKKENQNGSPRGAVFLSVTQPSLKPCFGSNLKFEGIELFTAFFGKWLSIFWKWLPKRAVSALFFFLSVSLLAATVIHINIKVILTGQQRKYKNCLFGHFHLNLKHHILKRHLD